VILAFAHHCIVVSAVDDARAFYEKMFGFRLLSEEGWSDSQLGDAAINSQNSICRGYLLQGHNCHLELFEFESPAQTSAAPSTLGAHELGIRHLAFFVDGCHAEYDRLLSLGGQLLGEPVDIGGGIHAVYCRDPFGNIIELCEISNEAEDPRKMPGVDKLGNYAG
jgi:catechol 2,3-dioxygenase-like lactoylglutathione lyase family enzyme